MKRGMIPVVDQSITMTAVASQLTLGFGTLTLTAGLST